MIFLFFSIINKVFCFAALLRCLPRELLSTTFAECGGQRVCLSSHGGSIFKGEKISLIIIVFAVSGLWYSLMWTYLQRCIFTLNFCSRVIHDDNSAV